MPYTERLAQQLAVVASIPPRVIGTAAQTIYSDVVDMKYHRRAIVIAQARSAGTRSVKGLTVKIWNCDASGTAASTALKTGSTIPVPGTAGSEPIAVYEIKAEDLAASGYGTGLNAPARYFKASITNSTNKRDSISMFVLADTSRYGPASDFDNADVYEISQP